MYQWILKQEGFKVSKTGYFVYVNGDQHFEDGMLENEIDKANMKFDVQLITYDGDCSWVEETIMKLQKCLHKKKCPSHSKSGFGPKAINSVSMQSYLMACRNTILSKSIV